MSKAKKRSEEDTTKTEKTTKETKKKRKKIQVLFIRERALTENSDDARELFNQSRFGSLLEDGKVQLSLLEALYLLEKGRIEVVDYRGKVVDEKSFLRKVRRLDPKFWIKYCVFKDLRNRGFIVKTALKFGADFRVYDRGIKPGEDHARWVLFPVHEGSTLTWHEWAAKNRVAHSTKKKLY